MMSMSALQAMVVVQQMVYARTPLVRDHVLAKLATLEMGLHVQILMNVLRTQTNVAIMQIARIQMVHIHARVNQDLRVSKSIM